MGDGRGTLISAEEAAFGRQFFYDMCIAANTGLEIPRFTFTTDGKLDRALHNATRGETDWSRHLEFYEGSTGLRCVEVPMMMASAADALILEQKPFYGYEFSISSRAARYGTEDEIIPRERMAYLARNVWRHLGITRTEQLMPTKIW